MSTEPKDEYKILIENLAEVPAMQKFAMEPIPQITKNLQLKTITAVNPSESLPKDLSATAKKNTVEAPKINPKNSDSGIGSLSSSRSSSISDLSNVTEVSSVSSVKDRMKMFEVKTQEFDAQPKTPAKFVTKPVISPKPELQPKPLIKSKPTLPPKPELQPKPLIKSKPVISPKPVIAAPSVNKTRRFSNLDVSSEIPVQTKKTPSPVLPKSKELTDTLDKALGREPTLQKTLSKAIAAQEKDSFITQNKIDEVKKVGNVSALKQFFSKLSQSPELNNPKAPIKPKPKPKTKTFVGR